MVTAFDKTKKFTKSDSSRFSVEANGIVADLLIVNAGKKSLIAS